MKAGDLVLIRRLNGGDEFVARLRQRGAGPGGCYGCADARGVVHWRVESEIRPARDDDPRVAAFLAQRPGAPGPAPAQDRTIEPKEKRSGPTLVERIVTALSECNGTAKDLAWRLGALRPTVHRALSDLYNRGLIRRVGTTEDQRPEIIWGLPE